MSADGNGGAKVARFDPGEPFTMAPAVGRDMPDLQMDQIRDLLFGEFRKVMEGRLAAIESRLSALESGLAAARAEEENRRRAAFDNLAEGIATLANQIRQTRI